jgi:hypothetical protein
MLCGPSLAIPETLKRVMKCLKTEKGKKIFDLLRKKRRAPTAPNRVPVMPVDSGVVPVVAPTAPNRVPVMPVQGEITTSLSFLDRLAEVLKPYPVLSERWVKDAISEIETRLDRIKCHGGNS